MQILLFTVEGRRCGLFLDRVGEVLRAATVTPLPGAPAVVRGVVDVRGLPVPVVGLREKFRLPRKEVETSDRFVVAMARDRPVALLVDGVEGIADVEPEDVSELDEFAMAPDYVAGVARLPDGLVLIHDLREFLTPSEAAGVDEAMSRSGAGVGGRG